MTFVIDTGNARQSNESDISRACYPGELDMMKPGVSDAEIADFMAQHLIGLIRTYKSEKGARDMLMKRMGLVQCIGKEAPHLFDWILTEYVEHVTCLTVERIRTGRNPATRAT